jgi:hypothetical protein
LRLISSNPTSKIIIPKSRSTDSNYASKGFLGSKAIYLASVGKDLNNKNLNRFKYYPGQYFAVNSLEELKTINSTVRNKSISYSIRSNGTNYVSTNNASTIDRIIEQAIVDKGSLLCTDFNRSLELNVNAIIATNVPNELIDETVNEYDNIATYKGIDFTITSKNTELNFDTTDYDNIVRSICLTEKACNSVKQRYNEQSDSKPCNIDIERIQNDIDLCYNESESTQSELEIDIPTETLKQNYVDSKSGIEKEIFQKIPNQVIECAANTSPEKNKNYLDHITDVIDIGLESIPILGSLYSTVKGISGKGITDQTSCIDRSLNTIFGIGGLISETAGLLTAGTGTVVAKATGITIKQSLKELFLQGGPKLIKTLAKNQLPTLLKNSIKDGLKGKIFSELINDSIKVILKQSNDYASLEVYDHPDEWNYENLDKVSYDLTDPLTPTSHAINLVKNNKLTFKQAGDGKLTLAKQGVKYRNIGMVAEERLKVSLGNIKKSVGDYEYQFKLNNGLPVGKNIKGTTIPDFYNKSNNTAIEIKAYNLNKNYDKSTIVRGYQKGLYGMIESFKKQYIKRLKELPENSKQKLIIDNQYFQDNQHTAEFIKSETSRIIGIDKSDILVLQKGNKIEELLKEFLK